MCIENVLSSLKVLRRLLTMVYKLELRGEFNYSGFQLRNETSFRSDIIFNLQPSSSLRDMLILSP